MKVMITGGLGFVGSHLCDELLHDNHEIILLARNDNIKENVIHNLDTIIFRITNSFGPREQYLTPVKNAINFLIYKAFKDEDVTIYNQGKFFRDVIYISDVISGLKTIMLNGKPGNLYWISSGNKT